MKNNHYSNERKIAKSAFYILTPLIASCATAATYTWDGGGSDDNWSTGANWVGDPTSPTPFVSGDTVIFDGTTRLSPNNNITGLTLGSNSITFAAGAGSFNIGGSGLTLGSATGSGYTIISKISTNDQTISAPLTLGSGGGDRSVVMTGGGQLTLSGNLNYSNSWLFPTTAAGTIVLSGNNTGSGKGSVLAGGTNQFRATIGNNVAGTQLVFGSNTALGNSSTGDLGAGGATLIGFQARQNTNIRTDSDRDLSAYAIVINATNVTFNGASNMSIGYIINQNGNRDFWVTSSGTVTVQSGVTMSHDAVGRNLYLNLTGTGGMVINGKLYDTFLSTGLTSGSSLLRKAGTATLVLNGDSSTYNGGISIEGGILRIGHASALGNTTGTTTVSSGATLDLNGQTIAEAISAIAGSGVGSNGALINSNTSAAATVLSDIVNPGNFTVGGAGDIVVPRVRSSGVFTITKVGSGTFQTTGNNHNNLAQWVIEAGKVILANTAGYGADRGVTLNGGTLQLSGTNSDLINDSQSFVINGGTFDLNGKSETVASVGGTGGTITNTQPSPVTLKVGGGTGGTSSGSFGGIIQDGAGTLSLTKEGSGTQTLTGMNTYSGDTVIMSGVLSISQPYLADGSSVWINSSGSFNLSFLGTDTIQSLYIDGVLQATGTWGGIGSGAAHETSLITGTGMLLTVVPEPAILGFLGIWSWFGIRRRR